MNRKKIYAMILTASMLAASACGSSTEPAAADASAENTAAASTAEMPTSTVPETSTANEAEASSSAAESSPAESSSEESASVEESSTAVDEGFADADETLYVTGSNVNVRRAPATTGEIAGTLNKGASLHCTGRKDDWSRVEYNGEICFVSSQFLSAEKPEETKPAAQAGTGIYHAGGDILVCIDAGHQDHQMTDKEPNGPGSSEMKNKVTSGTDGVSTGVPEYKVNLQVALKLRDELLSRGYSVIMTRETNDVSLSNVDRATIANDSGADIMIRLHCNSVDSSSARGALGITQTSSNPYCGDIYSACNSLTNAVLNGYCNATGLANTGIWETDTMAGTNWCEIPNTILEMGYMSNSTEDELLSDSDFQYEAAVGIANGIDAYFGR